MPDQTDPDFAFDHPCSPELRPSQSDKGMHELMVAIEEAGCSPELTKAIVLAGEQAARINRMKIKWEDRTAEIDRLNDRLVAAANSASRGERMDAIEQAQTEFKRLIAEARARYGRDFIRGLPQGKLLDALDANRESGFPTDA